MGSRALLGSLGDDPEGDPPPKFRIIYALHEDLLGQIHVLVRPGILEILLVVAFFEGVQARIFLNVPKQLVHQDTRRVIGNVRHVGQVALGGVLQIVDIGLYVRRDREDGTFSVRRLHVFDGFLGRRRMRHEDFSGNAQILQGGYVDWQYRSH